MQPEQQTPFFPNRLHQNHGAGILSQVLNWSKKGVHGIRARLRLHVAAASAVGPAELLAAHGALPDLCWVSCSLVPSPLIAPAALRRFVLAFTICADFTFVEYPFVTTNVLS